MTSDELSTVTPLGFLLTISLIGLLLCCIFSQLVRKSLCLTSDVSGGVQDSQDYLNGINVDQLLAYAGDDQNGDRNRNVDRRIDPDCDDDNVGLDVARRRSSRGFDRKHSNKRDDERDDRRRSQTNRSEGDRTWLDLFPHPDDGLSMASSCSSSSETGSYNSYPSL